MGVSTTYVPTEQEIRVVQTLYRELVAATPPVTDAIGAIGKRLGVSGDLVARIVAPIRVKKRTARSTEARRRRHSKWMQGIHARRRARVTAEEMAIVEAAHDAYMPEPPPGYHKLLFAQVALPRAVIDICVRRIRRRAGLPCWGDPAPDQPAQGDKQP